MGLDTRYIHNINDLWEFNFRLTARIFPRPSHQSWESGKDRSERKLPLWAQPDPLANSGAVNLHSAPITLVYTADSTGDTYVPWSYTFFPGVLYWCASPHIVPDPWSRGAVSWFRRRDASWMCVLISIPFFLKITSLMTRYINSGGNK
jgi:hypothetical protein